MYQNFRLLSLLGILSLTLVNFTGCGEKRVHVATVSGAPGDEIVLEPTDGISENQTRSGLGNPSIDESALLSQATDSEEHPTEPTTSAMENEPISMAHEATAGPTALASQNDSIDSSLSEASSLSPESEFSDNSSPFASLADGQDFSAQSSSSPEDQMNSSSSNMGDFQESSVSQASDAMATPFSHDSSAGSLGSLSGEGLEAIPDSLQIAKVEPSGTLEDQMNQIRNEELAAAAAGLEDVFFQFDSWTLTEEGRQSLQRTLGLFEQEPSTNLIIEGHADQRGTQAYNMVLAKKRAVAVQEYLSQLGIDASRLAVISYGKDKPFCQDATEVCYQLNRRGHLLVPNQ